MRLSFRFVIAVVAIALLPTCLCASADWPQEMARATNRDGHSPDTGLLKEWPTGGPKLLWKADGLGSGYTNVSVVGNRVFAMGDKGNANYVIAINRGTRPAAVEGEGRPGGGAPGWGSFAGPALPRPSSPATSSSPSGSMARWAVRRCR